jgi:hypothetical protein
MEIFLSARSVVLFRDHGDGLVPPPTVAVFVKSDMQRSSSSSHDDETIALTHLLLLSNRASFRRRSRGCTCPTPSYSWDLPI